LPGKAAHVVSAFGISSSLQRARANISARLCALKRSLCPSPQASVAITDASIIKAWEIASTIGLGKNRGHACRTLYSKAMNNIFV
jgi:hypothetical protein